MTQKQKSVCLLVIAAAAALFLLLNVGELVSRFNRAVSASVGWDEAAKRQYADQVELNQRYADAAERLGSDGAARPVRGKKHAH